jgi:hypothetical protein
MAYCPSRVELEQYLRGDIGDPELEERSLHIEECAPCQRVLDALTQGSLVARLRDINREGNRAVASPTVNKRRLEPISGAREPTTPSFRGRGGADDTAERSRSSPPNPVSSKPAPQVLPTIVWFRIIREIGRGGMGVVYEAEEETG